MALRYFGKDFTYDFYPLEADGFDYEILGGSPDSVYLYDGYPTEDDAAAGTTLDGSYTLLETVLAWADTEDARGKRIQFSAVDEPSDLSGFSRKYYVVINTSLDNALPPVIKEVTLQRLRAQESLIDVSVMDILAEEPMIEVEFSNCVEDLQRYLDAATAKVKRMLNTCTRDFASFTDPAKINSAVIALTLSNFYLGQSRNPNDIHFSNGLRFKEDFSIEMKRISLEFDDDRDGIPDGKVKSPSGIKTLRILK